MYTTTCVIPIISNLSGSVVPAALASRDGREEESGDRGPRLSHARRGEVELVGSGGRVTSSEIQADVGKYIFDRFHDNY